MQISRGYCVSLLAALATVLLPPDRLHAANPSGIANGTWTGFFSLPAGRTPVQVDMQLRGSAAQIALGPGHTTLQTTSVRRVGTALGFSLPGDPAPLKFAIASRGSALTGTVTQGRARGTVRLRGRTATTSRFLGTYQTAAGDDLIILDLSRLGLPPQMIDVGTDGIHALYRSSSRSYAVGAGQAVRSPREGTITFSSGGRSLSLSLGAGGATAAERAPFRAQEVRLWNGAIPLAGTLLMPAGVGPFPAVVLVHGSGPSLRDEGQAFSSFLALHGIASLSMDKRGEGESGGQYLGEFASEKAIAGYASDAVAGGRFLANRKDIDPHRIGLFGGSQAGWVIPRAAVTGGSLFSFAVILSGPVVSEGESDYYESLCYAGGQPPDMTPDQIDAAVEKQGPSGVDPRADLLRLRIPILWVYGALDQNQPTRLDIPILERLEAATGADFSWVVFPHANHGLVDTKTGLNSEAAASSNFAHGFFADLAAWLRMHGLGN